MTLSAPPSARAAEHPKRRDIQGLRALALLLVIGYHLRPDLLPGGFLGVDVFFVISGYLIIGSLGAEAIASARIDLGRFYSKRIRRLLPAATVTLVAVAAYTMWQHPVAAWSDTLREVLAAALNVQNWFLAALSADYTQATAAASPVQHFWSLSVEEQFYLVMPPIMVLAALLAARAPIHRRAVVLAVVAVVTLASFVFSVLYTPEHHGAAYFITPTRMWQLGVGGLLALVQQERALPYRVRLPLGWVALAVVLVCSRLYSTGLAFPGWIALVPTLAAAGLLATGFGGGSRVRRSRPLEVGSLLGRQPWHYVGDISYSLYLWHWPVIVAFMAVVSGPHLPWPTALAAVAVSGALAVVSTHLVEAPFRRPGVVVGALGRALHRPIRRSPVLDRRRAFGLGVACLLVSVLVAAPGVAASSVERAKQIDALTVEPTPANPGWLALGGRPPSRSTIDPGAALLPAPAVALQDVSASFTHGCDYYDLTEFPVTSDHCLFGNPEAPNLAILVGDSHAGQFSTALIESIELRPNWRLVIIDMSGCPFSTEPPRLKGVPFENCREHDMQVLESIRSARPRVVITGAMSPRSYQLDLDWDWGSYANQVAGYRSMYTEVTRTGARVLVLAELPRPVRNVPTCLLENPGDPLQCDSPVTAALQSQDRPMVEAAADLPGADVLDPLPVLCNESSCPAVIGNVIVNRDNHLSNTYVKSITTWLDPRWGLD